MVLSDCRVINIWSQNQAYIQSWLKCQPEFNVILSTNNYGSIFITFSQFIYDFLQMSYGSFHVKLYHFQYHTLHFTRFLVYAILCNSNVMILMIYSSQKYFTQQLRSSVVGLNRFEKKIGNHEITVAQDWCYNIVFDVKIYFQCLLMCLTL